MKQLLFLFFLKMTMAYSHIILYEAPSGRFGDQLIAYMHAKWLSYRHDIPLLYKPFIFSHELLLDEKELPHDDKASHWPQILVENDQTIEHYASQGEVAF